MHASSESVDDTPENPNDISISFAETQSGNEHEPSDNVNNDVHVDAQPSNNNDVEIEPTVDLDNPQSKNQRYDKRYFVVVAPRLRENRNAPYSIPDIGEKSSRMRHCLA